MARSPRDARAAGRHGRVRARHGVPSLRARRARGHPGGVSRGLRTARSPARARDERRARRDADARAVRRALRSRRRVRLAGRPGIRDLHRCEDARPCRPGRRALEADERLGAHRRAALQPLGRASGARREDDPSLLRYVQICDAGPDMPARAIRRRSSAKPARAGSSPARACCRWRSSSRRCPPACRWPWRRPAARPPIFRLSSARSARSSARRAGRPGRGAPTRR